MANSNPAEELVTLEAVRAAADRLDGVVHRTPTDPSTTFAAMSDAAEVYLKLENLQRAGSFKIRGAYNRISGLPAADRAAGVVTVSAGNHAQGVALAARLLDVEATVVMPEAAPAAKVAATRGYGATVVQGGETYAELRERADRLIDERGLTMVHPFADPAVIAGQGTLGLEVVEDVPDPDVVVVPVGGGGLASGVATAVADRDTRVVGVETEGTAHAARAVEQGSVHVREAVDTVAEGIAAGQTEPLTLAHLRERVDEVVQVTDGDALEALALLAERANVVAEPAGALPTAALLSGAVDAAGETAVAVVSGGNVDLTAFGELARIGLAGLDRYRRVHLAVADWPASVGAVGDVVAARGASLADLALAGAGADAPPNRKHVVAAVAGSDPDHLDEVIAALDDHGSLSVLRVEGGERT